jgi:hypothetical protein
MNREPCWSLQNSSQASIMSRSSNFRTCARTITSSIPAHRVFNIHAGMYRAQAFYVRICIAYWHTNAPSAKQRLTSKEVDVHMVQQAHALLRRPDMSANASHEFATLFSNNICSSSIDPSTLLVLNSSNNALLLGSPGPWPITSPLPRSLPKTAPAAASLVYLPRDMPITSIMLIPAPSNLARSISLRPISPCADMSCCICCQGTCPCNH